MRVRWADRALCDAAEAFDYIAVDKKGAAERFAGRLLGNGLAEMPMVGRSIGGGKRVLVVDRYLLFYRLAGGEVQVLRIVHGARRRRRT